MGIASILSRLTAKAELIDGMMSTVGVRDEFSHMQGGAEALRLATMRCMSCSKPGACASWLSEHETAAEAPDFCRNQDLFVRLRETIDSRAG